MRRALSMNFIQGPDVIRCRQNTGLFSQWLFSLCLFFVKRAMYFIQGPDVIRLRAKYMALFRQNTWLFFVKRVMYFIQGPDVIRLQAKYMALFTKHGLCSQNTGLFHTM